MPLNSFGGINTLPSHFEALADEKRANFRPENDAKSRRWRSAFFIFNPQKGSDAAIPRMSKKRKLEWAFFLNERNRITYNKLCLRCQKKCKQSFRCLVIQCPKYEKKEKKTNGRA